MAAPSWASSVRPSIATRVTIFSFCCPTVVACETEYAGVDRGGLPESDGRL